MYVDLTFDDINDIYFILDDWVDMKFGDDNPEHDDVRDRIERLQSGLQRSDEYKIEMIIRMQMAVAEAKTKKKSKSEKEYTEGRKLNI